jgi:hypothetical protein
MEFKAERASDIKQLDQVNALSASLDFVDRGLSASDLSSQGSLS